MNLVLRFLQWMVMIFYFMIAQYCTRNLMYLSTFLFFSSNSNIFRSGCSNESESIQVRKKQSKKTKRKKNNTGSLNTDSSLNTTLPPKRTLYDDKTVEIKNNNLQCSLLASNSSSSSIECNNGNLNSQTSTVSETSYNSEGCLLYTSPNPRDS